MLTPFLALSLGTVGSFLSVVGAHSVGREWGGLILAIFLGDGLFRCCPIPDQLGWPSQSDGRSGITSGLVHLGLRPLSAGPPLASLA